MKLIIEFNGVKREIDGDFAVCGSGRDLQLLMCALRERVGNGNEPQFSYGWIEVREPLPRVANLKPIPWHADGAMRPLEGPL